MGNPVIDATAFYEFALAGRINDIPALLHDDFEFHALPGFPHGGIYRGWPAVATEFFPALFGDFSSWAAKPTTVVAADGERVLVIGHYQAGIKGTDEVAQFPFVHVWDTRDGKLCIARSYTDTAAIQAAVARGRV